MNFAAIAAAAALAVLGTSAQAATLLAQPASTGVIASPGSRSFTFDAGAGTGAINFVLEGYNTLDGAGSGGYEDLFTLTLNGNVLSRAYFNLGGNGGNSVVSGASPVSTVYNGYNQGGTATYALTNVSFLSGANTLTFGYTSGIAQGTGDEGWGVRGLSATGNAPVPEPATWAMMIVGFGVVGGTMRRRARAKVAFA